MKLKCIVALFLCSIIYQNILLAQSETKLHDFSNYIGTWKYETEHEEFIIKIKEYYYISTSFREPETMHYLVAAYKYVKEGNVIYDYLDNLNKYDPTNHQNYKNRCITFHSKSGKEQGLWISYKDSKTINTSSYDSCLRIHTFNPDQLIFHIEPDMWERDTGAFDENGNWYTITDPEKLNGFSIPTDMILIRIE